MSADGRRAASVPKNGVVRVWDVDAGAAVGATLCRHVDADGEKTTSITAKVAMSADGLAAAVSGEGLTVTVGVARGGLTVGASGKRRKTCRAVRMWEVGGQWPVGAACKASWARLCGDAV
ncbi:WD40/YVTN repeat-like containing protein [Gracilaria domingensis]|nr:WD40/YVTN repeat-like containing protein [Gracilaria domingensis]